MQKKLSILSKIIYLKTSISEIFAFTLFCLLFIYLCLLFIQNKIFILNYFWQFGEILNNTTFSYK